MKFRFAFILFATHFVALITTNAFDGLPLWTNRCGPGGWPMAIAADANGNVAVAGNDLVIKYSNSGTALWTNRHETLSGSAVPQSMAVDASGNVIVTGIFDGEETGDDFETIKYSSTGEPLWTNRYTGYSYGYDWPRGLAVDTNGNVFVTGFSENEGFSEDFLTIAYSPLGMPLWTNRYNGSNNGDDQPTAIAVGADGNVYVTGTSQWFLFRTFFTTIKYSGAGVPIWTNHYGFGQDDAANATSIALDTSGNAIVTGYSYDIGTDYATVKYSNAGLPLWTNRYNGSGNFYDEPISVRTDSTGNSFVTGVSANDTGGGDITTLAYSSLGIPLWTNRYGVPPNSAGSAAALVVDRFGNVIVTGFCVNTNNSYPDFLTLKYSNSGIPLWTNSYGTPLGFDDRSVAAAADDDGNVFVTGPSQASNTQGDYAYVTIKYSKGLPQPTPLVFTALKGQLVLSWTNTVFRLESSTNLTRPFAPVSNATSPFTNDISELQRFFRLKAD